MGDLTKGYTFSAGEVVTPAKLHALIESAEIKAGMVGTAEIADGAITSAKLDSGVAFSVSKVTLANGKVMVGNGSGVGSEVLVDTDTMDAAGFGVKDGGIGATQLASGAVTTAKIADANVTLAKLANIATARLLGRSTAGSGVPEELTVGTGLSLSGGALTCTVTTPTRVTLANKTITQSPGAIDYWTHGLGSTPSFISLWLECISNDSTSGHSTGDRIPIGQVDWKSGDESWSCIRVHWNATRVQFSVYDNVFLVAHKASGTLVNLSSTLSSNWRIGGIAEA